MGAVWTQPGQYLNHYNPYYPNQDDYVAANWTAPQVTNDGPAAYVTDNVNFAYDMYQPWASGADYQGERSDKLHDLRRLALELRSA